MSSLKGAAHPVLRALCAGVGISDPSEAVSRAVHTAVSAAREQGWPGPPFDPAILASLRGYKVTRVATLGTRQREGGWVARRILIRSDLTGNRFRFALAHEVVHGIIEDTTKGVEERDSPTEDQVGELERCCQAGAAEILMPEDCLDAQLKPEAGAIDTISAVARSFDVSAKSAARRCVHVSDAAVVLVKAVPSAEFDKLSHLQGRALTTRIVPKGDDLLVAAWQASRAARQFHRVSVGEPVPRASKMRRAYFLKREQPREPAIFVARETWREYPELTDFTLVAAPLPFQGQPRGSLGLLWWA